MITIDKSAALARLLNKSATVKAPVKRKSGPSQSQKLKARAALGKRTEALAAAIMALEETLQEMRAVYVGAIADPDVTLDTFNPQIVRSEARKAARKAEIALQFKAKVAHLLD